MDIQNSIVNGNVTSEKRTLVNFSNSYAFVTWGSNFLQNYCKYFDVEYTRCSTDF